MTTPDCPPGRYLTLLAAGRDAASFLQGQLTQDVLTMEGLLPSALLTAQGRVLATPWVLADADSRRLLLATGLADAVLQHLRRYVLRSKLTLSLAEPTESDREQLRAFVAQRLAGTNAGSWPLALIRAGLADVDAASSGEWIPQMINLDLIGAISFKKGCYTGQEIVARTQHLGRIKRRMQRYLGSGELPSPGSALRAGEAKVGEVVAAAADGAAVELLAVVNLDARSAALTLADGRAFTSAPLPYVVG
ncbi:MAG: hypothetical protein WCH32_16715 [Pseudomonadota bacterium]